MFFTAEVSKYKIPSHIFAMKEILSVFDKVKLSVNEVKIPNSYEL